MQFFNKIGDVSVRPYLKGSFLWLSVRCCVFCSVHGSARFGSSCPETVPTCVGIAALSHGIEDKQIHSCGVKQVLKWISSLCSSVSRYPPRLLVLVFPSLQLSVEESAAYFLCSSSSFSSSSSSYLYSFNHPLPLGSSIRAAQMLHSCGPDWMFNWMVKICRDIQLYFKLNNIFCKLIASIRHALKSVCPTSSEVW